MKPTKVNIPSVGLSVRLQEMPSSQASKSLQMPLNYQLWSAWPMTSQTQECSNRTNDIKTLLVSAELPIDVRAKLNQCVDVAFGRAKVDQLVRARQDDEEMQAEKE